LQNQVSEIQYCLYSFQC